MMTLIARMLVVKLNSRQGDHLFTVVSCDDGELRTNVAIWLVLGGFSVLIFCRSVCLDFDLLQAG